MQKDCTTRRNHAKSPFLQSLYARVRTATAVIHKAAPTSSSNYQIKNVVYKQNNEYYYCNILIYIRHSPLPFCYHSVGAVAGRRLNNNSTCRVVLANLSGKPTTMAQVRTFAGLEDFIGKPDNLIPTDRERRFKKPKMPDDVPEALKKDLEALGLDAPEDLDEMEEAQAGFQESGLVPPENAGTFASPILIPSRLHERVVGYTDPTTHALFWFNIQDDGNLYYIKDLGLFFKMHKINDEAASAHH